jgi:hypothetical protein
MSSKNRRLFESKFESSSVAFLGQFPPIKARVFSGGRAYLVAGSLPPAGCG